MLDLKIGEKFVQSIESSGNKQNQLNQSLNALIKGKLDVVSGEFEIEVASRVALGLMELYRYNEKVKEYQSDISQVKALLADFAPAQ